MVEAPTDKQRTIILGRTGSGKSVFANHLMSSRDFHRKPWVMTDYKGDDLITEIVSDNRIPEISPKDKPPKKPGLYWMKPAPIVDDEAVENWLMRVWSQGNIGLYIDEGYALPNKAAFDMILTQGRSLRIPVIALYQRPVYMSRFAIAQADFFAVFEQNDERDLKTTKQFVPAADLPNGKKIGVFERLPKYHCLWHCVGHGRTDVLSPAPGPDIIRQVFRDRLKKTYTGFI